MTTEAAANLYLAQHLFDMQGRKLAIWNPHNRPVEDLPTIYGFNNGGSRGWLSAVLVSEDGAWMGGHCCSDEGYMQHDLGILEGARPDRHECFKKHYPDGYRMEFVGYDAFKQHKKLQAACALANANEATK